jgi:hypothetical protein
MKVYLREGRSKNVLGFTIQIEKETLSRGFYPVHDALTFLKDLIDPDVQRGRNVEIVVEGHFGNSFSVDTGPNTVGTSVIRRVHRLWLTQAVQAEAALIPQLVACPY